jgi:hypothetical protein
MGAYMFVTKEELQAERRSTRKHPSWTCSSTTQTGLHRRRRRPF